MVIQNGIRVNCIAPGIFPSGMIHIVDTENVIAKAIQEVPLKRPGKNAVVSHYDKLIAGYRGYCFGSME